MASLVLEGGSFRGNFTAGVIDALLSEHIEFPYVIGVSAGISNGTAYLSKQIGRNMEIMDTYRKDPRYEGPMNLRSDHSLFGVKFIYETIPNELLPLDYDTYYAFPGTAYAVVTNAQSGKAEYMNCLKGYKDNRIFKATCALPLLFPMVKINGFDYVDGGISDSIPVQKAILDGQDKHLIVLTRPKGYVKTIDGKTRFAANFLKRNYPHLSNAMLRRARMYNEQVAFCERLERDGKAVIIRPSHDLNSLESDLEKIHAMHEEGYRLAMQQMDRIRNLF